MKRLLLSIILVLIVASTLPAQALQKLHCGDLTVCFLQGVKARDTLVVVGDGGTPTDTQNDAFIALGMQAWYGNYVNLWYAKAIGGDTTLNFTALPQSVYFAEYPAAAFDQASNTTLLCCSPSASVGPLTTTEPNELLILWTGFAKGVSATQVPSNGFTIEDTGTDFTVEVQTIHPGTYTATVLQGPNASGSRLAAFVLTVPPPLPQTVNFSISGNLSWNDGTPVQGRVDVQQFQQSQNVFNGLGTFFPDANGNIGGTIMLATNFADLPTFQFILFDATGKQQGLIQASLPGATFQGIKSVTGFKIVIDKASCATACKLASGSTLGVLGP